MTDESDPQLPSGNPVLPEGINASPQNPIKELLILTTGVIAVFIILSVILWQSLTFTAQYIPLAWEARLAEPFVSEDSGSDVQQRLQTRLDRLLVALEYDGDLPIRVNYIDNETVNAFATLGGQIFVFQGLLDAVTTDIGLDLVLAHEAAHILNRDPIQGAAGALGVQVVFALITGGGDFAQVSGLMDAGGQLLLLSYSREQEREADALAMDALSRVYEDLTGADELFVYLESLDTELETPEFLSTHPDTDSRIEFIREFIQSHQHE